MTTACRLCPRRVLVHLHLIQKGIEMRGLMHKMEFPGGKKQCQLSQEEVRKDIMHP
jgi:hypothetical protein